MLAVTDHAHTLAAAVDELLVLARNQAGGACIWCGSRDLAVAQPRGVDGGCTVIACRSCGTELESERAVPLRSRWT